MNDQKNRALYVVLVVAIVTCIWLPTRTIADEKLDVIQEATDPQEIIDRLMIFAYTYRLSVSSKNPPVGYFIQFEHWKMGELKQTQRTKSFKLDPEEENPSFFIAFPTPPRKEVFVSPSGGDGVFWEELKFPLAACHDGSMRHLEEASIKDPEAGMSVMLGYHLVGMAQGLGPEGNKLGEANDPLAVLLERYHKRLVKHNRNEVDVLVFRLVFE